MTTLLLNEKLNGVELYFDIKPLQEIISNLKANKFRWNGKKRCWYAKQSETTLKLAKTLTDSNSEQVTPPEQKQKNISLWDLTRWNDIEVNNKQETKAIAAEIRKHVKKRFPMCKFSVRSSYSSISFYIVSSPYEKDSKYLKAIINYCTNLIKAYQYCTCYDPYGDYGSSSNFYGAYANISYDYIQTEVTEKVKNMIKDFDIKLAEYEKLEEEKREIEYQEQQKKYEEQEKAYKKQLEIEKEQQEIIYNSVEVVTLEEDKQYFVVGTQFANLNKNNTLDQYKEEVKKGDYYLQDVKITKEIHFQNGNSLEYFRNMLLHDFDFLTNTGGSYTDDNRINSMTDYYNMEKEEQQTIDWLNYAVAIYYNNQLQFVVDAQGYSYSRYVGLVDNVTIKNDYNTKQTVTGEELEQLKNKAESITGISFNIIAENNLVDTWNNNNWSEYKELMKEQLKKQNIKLSKPIIQQLPEDMEQLKVSMYKLLIEVDGIQEQFKNANLQQGQKVTLFYISDFGGIVTSRITLDSVENSSYAQYDNAIKLTFKPEGKRKLYYNYFYSTLLVYNSWLDLPDEVLHEVEKTAYGTVTKTKYLSCDKKQYDEILNYFEEQGHKPIVNTYKPMF